MKRNDILKLYDRLTGLVEKLPGGIQKPILAELHPIRELFIEQRPARILLVGSGTVPTVPAFLHDLTGHSVETGEAAAPGARTYRIPDRGEVEIIDARVDVPDGVMENAIAAGSFDIAILLRDGASDAEAFAPAIESAKIRIARMRDRQEAPLPLVGLAVPASDASTSEMDEARERLSALLHAQEGFAPSAVFSLRAESSDAISESICSQLPLPARLEFARFTVARGAQKAIAERLLKSFAALCGVIGVQPIPLADLPILTALQSLMVSLIIYVSGRKASPKLAAEFAAAVGINVGAGFLFREGARAVLKFIPVWGHAVSGAVAAAGTYAIGRAAIAYFIEGGSKARALLEFQKHQSLPSSGK